jgi:hypothetical protein
MKALMLAVILSVQVFGTETNLITRSGTIYTNASVDRVLPTGLLITYATGKRGFAMAKIPFSDLAPEIRDKYTNQIAGAVAAEAERLQRGHRLAQQEQAEKERKLNEARWNAYVQSLVNESRMKWEQAKQDEERYQQEQVFRSQLLAALSNRPQPQVIVQPVPAQGPATVIVEPPSSYNRQLDEVQTQLRNMQNEMFFNEMRRKYKF